MKAKLISGDTIMALIGARNGTFPPQGLVSKLQMRHTGTYEAYKLVDDAQTLNIDENGKKVLKRQVSCAALFAEKWSSLALFGSIVSI